ncbi:MAG: penicillin-binding transpeptidase domain-containing protein [Phycisphaerales bacterium]
MPISDLIPRMFHRRLLIIMGLVVAGLSVPLIQTARLTTTRHEELLRAAESKLVTRQWTPSVRGNIVDRKGRILAQDRPSYDVAIDYDVLKGTWAAKKAEELARSNRVQWNEMGPTQRKALIEKLTALLDERVQSGLTELARAAAIDRAKLDALAQASVGEVDQLYDSIRDRRRQEMIRDAVKSPDAGPDRVLTKDELRKIEIAAAKPIVEQQRAVSVLKRISDTTAFELELLTEGKVELAGALDLLDPLPDPDKILISRIPGVRVIDTGDREYPLDSMTITLDRARFPMPMRSDTTIQVPVEGVAGHILGWMRGRVFQEDQERRNIQIANDPALAARVLTSAGVDRGEYRERDRVGSSGIEASMEHRLRGLRGLRTQHLDRISQTDEIEMLPAEIGGTVPLTIDGMLQARVQAIMSPAAGLAVVQDWHGTPNETMPIGTPLAGAAVVLDVDTGDILAMVSMPEVSRRVIKENPEQIFNDKINVPFLNRAIAKPYPPGSIVKPLILTGAAQRGNFIQGQTIDCTGHLLPNEPNMLRCWIYKRFDQTHTQQLGHTLSAAEGIKVSCNIFFFTLGKRLGPEAISDVYREFGVTQSWNLGIGSEYSGSLAGYGNKRDLTMGEAIQMGIGQGPVTWTPLHAADAYATLARSGVRVTPRIIADSPRSQPVELGLPQWAVQDAMEGLAGSVGDELGTGNHLSIDGVRDPIFNIPGVRILGKTGTAAAPDLKFGSSADDDGIGPGPNEVVRSGDHSWFVVLVGKPNERAKYVISVVMEYAGSGGKVSGPIVNQIIQALRDEGYL